MEVTKKLVEFEVNIPNISFPEFIFSCLRQHGNEIYMVDSETGKSYNFSEVEELSRKLGSGLLHRGFRPGDMVCFIANNCSDIIITFIGVTVVGGCSTFANALLTKEELLRQVVDSGAVYIVTDEECMQKARQIKRELPHQVREIFLVGSNGPNSIIAMTRNQRAVDNSILEKKDPVNTEIILLYSSGTTGLPKGVLHTHSSFIAGICAYSNNPYCPVVKDGVTMCVLPLCYLATFHLVFLSLCVGAKVIYLRRFQYELFVDIIDKYKVTFLPAVPTMLEILVQKETPPNRDLRSLTSIFITGDMTHPQSIKRFRQKYPFLQQLMNGYGTTEVSIVFMNLVDENGLQQVSLKPSCVETKIVDVDTSKEVLPNIGGELLVRSPLIMKGYWNRPEESKRIFTDDGWVRTGDIACCDEDGLIFFVGRNKNLIKYKAHQVSPIELESILLTHEAVSSAVVIGITDSICGEVPRAYIILKPGYSHITANDIRKYVAARTAPYKHLRGGVQFVKEFPKSPVGKVLRKQLREEFENQLRSRRRVKSKIMPLSKL